MSLDELAVTDISIPNTVHTTVVSTSFLITSYNELPETIMSTQTFLLRQMFRTSVTEQFCGQRMLSLFDNGKVFKGQVINLATARSLEPRSKHNNIHESRVGGQNGYSS